MARPTSRSPLRLVPGQREKERSRQAAHPPSRFAVALILSCSLLLSKRTPALVQSSPQDELTAASAAERAARFDEAVRHYRSFLASSGASAPSSALIEVRTRLATALFMLHRYQESLDAVEPVLSKSSGTAGAIAQEPRRQEETIFTQAYLVRGLDELQIARPDDRRLISEATQSLLRALQLNPDSGTARMALGDALARSEHLDEAADQYREQSRRTPDLADAWYKLGFVYTDLARRTAERFARDNPKNDLAIQLTAERLYEGGDYWAAAQALFHAVHGPDSGAGRSSARRAGDQEQSASGIPPGLRASFGAALIQIGYNRAAEAEFNAELSQDPDSLPARLGMVELNALKSNWASAVNGLQQLMAAYPEELAQQLESAPGSAFSRAATSQAQAMPADLAQSPAGRLWTRWAGSSGMESAAQFIAGDSGRTQCSSPPSTRQREPGYWLTEGCAAQLLGDLKSRQHSTADLRAKLAETQYRLGDFDSSRASALALLKLAPTNPWGRYWLAKSYAALAGQCFEKLAQVSPNSARVDEILARYHSEHQQLAAARSEYQAALLLEPDLPDLHLGLGTVYWQSGDWASAETELKRALELSPESAVAAYELGDSYLQQHQWRQAAEYLPRALTDQDVARKVRLDLAKAEDELGDHAAAISMLLLLAKDDQDGEVHYRLAAVYRETGDTAKAKAALAVSETLRKSSDQQSIEKLEFLQ